MGTPFVTPYATHVMLSRFLWSRRRTGQVGFDEWGIALDGALLVPRAQVREAYVVMGGRVHPAVRVRRKGLLPPLDIHLSTVEEGRLALRALGFDGAQAVLDVSVTSPRLGDPRVETRLGFAFLLTLLALFPLLIAIFNTPYQVGMGILAVWGLALAFEIVLLPTPGKLPIGGDGLLFSWFGRKRFLAYRDVLVVHTMQTSVMWNGPVVESSSSSPDKAVQIVMPEGAETYERIAEVADAWWRREGSVRNALVHRGSHDAWAWLRPPAGHWRAPATVGYRTATMADDAVGGTVEDDAAPSDARAGVAAALARALGDDGRARPSARLHERRRSPSSGLPSSSRRRAAPWRRTTRPSSRRSRRSRRSPAAAVTRASWTANAPDDLMRRARGRRRRVG